jgi:hypothetical protein
MRARNASGFIHAPKMKLQHWRGVSGNFGLSSAPVLEFELMMSESQDE